jgi:hypothetical protein
LHQSYLGAIIAAHTVYAVLFDTDPLQTPALNSNVPAETLDLVRSAVKASLEAEAAAAIRR